MLRYSPWPHHGSVSGTTFALRGPQSVIIGALSFQIEGGVAMEAAVIMIVTCRLEHVSFSAPLPSLQWEADQAGHLTRNSAALASCLNNRP